MLYTSVCYCVCMCHCVSVHVFVCYCVGVCVLLCVCARVHVFLVVAVCSQCEWQVHPGPSAGLHLPSETQAFSSTTSVCSMCRSPSIVTAKYRRGPVVPRVIKPILWCLQ